MKCFKCRREIDEKSHYFEFNEMLEGKSVRKDYAHKECWDLIKSTLNLTSKLNDMMNSISDALPSSKKQEFIIE